MDAERLGYAGLIKNGKFEDWFSGANSMLDQARRQVAAASGAPVHWHVAEPKAASAIRYLLPDAGISGIDVIYSRVIP